MRATAPIFKHLVLVGGGHAHALVIKMWAMKPLVGVRVTLVSPRWQTPYPGMLPGLLAGHYQSDEIHIDLRRLCSWAGFRFIEDAVIGLNTEYKTLRLQSHPDIEYDVLSLDIGSTPDTRLPGLKEFAQAVKPVDLFYPRYQALLERCEAASTNNPLRVGVVGGGAGGVEVIMALAHSLKNDRTKVELNLVIRDQKILASYPNNVGAAAAKALKKAGVTVHNHFDVKEVKADKLCAKQGEEISLDEMFFCTQALAASWPAKAGLDCDSRGFVKVNSFLQSLSAPDVFAVGDIAAMVETPRPKAGVYAVRQAPYLFSNLKQYLLGQTLKPYKPQDRFLSLLSLGGKKALAAKQSLSLTSTILQPLLWQLKNYIDRKFMDTVNDFTVPTMQAGTPARLETSLIPEEDKNDITDPQKRCSGCGGKIGMPTLQEALIEVTSAKTFIPEDAVDLEIELAPTGSKILQTVDQIRSPIDDPYRFGQVAALHALSDIFAVNAMPISAQILLNLPYAGKRIQSLEMRTIMRGLLSELDKHECKLVGGHTAEASELSIGMVINARNDPSKALFSKGALKPGDSLVLTKPIGTGVILAANMQSDASGEWYNAALSSMLKSNQNAATLFSNLDVLSCTDVTGFGLIGHLIEMLKASACSATLSLENIPLLEGALALSQQGIRSSLYLQNLQAIDSLTIPRHSKDHPTFPLLFDPQTSGGLLAGVNEEALESLRKQNDIDVHVIGYIGPPTAGRDWDLKIEKAL